tara:strand:+ start:813 stop:959 length:147 start_codon:yes stop_codon:yes gene_type:complete
MGKNKYYLSNCCNMPIIWNFSTKADNKGLCTKCKNWATVIEKEIIVNV